MPSYMLWVDDIDEPIIGILILQKMKLRVKESIGVCFLVYSEYKQM